MFFFHCLIQISVFPIWWICVKFTPSGSTFMPAMLNSFIHVWVYSYYGLSAIGPHMSKYLWWKRYLTIFQLFQFVYGIVLGINSLHMTCDFPLWMKNFLVCYMLSMFVLFGHFYIKEYKKKLRSKSKAEYEKYEQLA